MRRPPPLDTCIHYPITMGIAVLAIVATLRYWSGMDIERFMIGSDGWLREPWRLITPTLFHGDILHLVFNLYWLWLFGTCIESELGSGRALGIYVLLAVGSTTAERAFSHGGIGLSGVVYGQFGLLWVLAKHDRRFWDAVDRQTVQLLVGWFFLCIVLTMADVWRIANVAHGMGCLLGVLLGWTMSAGSVGRRWLHGAVLATVVVLCVAGGTVARPYVNLTGDAVRADVLEFEIEELPDDSDTDSADR